MEAGTRQQPAGRGAHFYDSYQGLDGKWLSVGAIEPQFYALLLKNAGIADLSFRARWDREQWADLKLTLATVLLKKTRAE